MYPNDRASTPNRPQFTKSAAKTGGRTRNKFRPLRGPRPQCFTTQNEQLRRFLDFARDRLCDIPSVKRSNQLRQKLEIRAKDQKANSSGLSPTATRTDSDSKASLASSTGDLYCRVNDSLLKLLRETLAAMRQIDSALLTDEELSQVLGRVGPTARTNAPAWRDVHPMVQTMAVCEAAQHFAGLAFTARFGADELNGMSTSTDLDSNKIRDAIARRFLAETGRKVEFYFRIELKNAKGEWSPHLHGVVLPGDLKEDAIRRCLNLALGPWGGVCKRFQTKCVDLHDGAGWGRYISKEIVLVDRTEARELKAGTRLIQQVAKELYEAYRYTYGQLDRERKRRGLETLRFAIMLPFDSEVARILGSTDPGQDRMRTANQTIH